MGYYSYGCKAFIPTRSRAGSSARDRCGDLFIHKLSSVFDGLLLYQGRGSQVAWLLFHIPNTDKVALKQKATGY